MSATAHGPGPARPLRLGLGPAEAVARWPAGVGLAAIVSGGGGPRARWSILGVPARRHIGLAPPGPPAAAVGGGPFPGRGWIGLLPYELGRELEPRASTRRSGAPTLGTWLRIDDALVHDHREGRWWSVGGGAAIAGLLAGAPRGYELRGLESDTGEEAYQRKVRRAVEYIRAGDVYQVNLSHVLRGAFRGSARGLFARLAERAAPWYGAYVELDEGEHRRAVLSLSPECFFEIENGRVAARPMKGTRPGGGDEAELRASDKDLAELNMIIDLMRNDLGRVCELGSVRVEAAREIELHGTARAGILQATATISGRLRAGVGPEGVLRAVFPAGSVTGAPKVRAMQIIEELEGRERGDYCGAIGFVGDDGRTAFNVAIRTATIRGRTGPRAADEFEDADFTFPVGAGIVAESEPAMEWQETLDKAWPLAGEVRHGALSAVEPR